MEEVKGKLGAMFDKKEQSKEDEKEKKEDENTGDGTEIIKKLMKHD